MGLPPLFAGEVDERQRGRWGLVLTSLAGRVVVGIGGVHAARLLL